MVAPHEHVLEYVDAYLHDALAPADRDRVQRHCRECRICRTALDEAEKRTAAYRSVPVCEASESLIRESLDRIGGPPPRPLIQQVSRVFWWSVAATAAIIGMVHVVTLNLSPSNYDLVVLGQSELMPDTEASLRVRLIHRQRHSGVPNASVDIELVRADGEPAVHLVSFTTDSDGTARPNLQLPAWPDGEYELKISAESGRRREVIRRTIALKRSWKLMLTTDKPVYQPGHTIRVRSLALRRPDLKPVAGEPVVYSVTDPKGNVVLRQRDVTSRFGIASADCALATEIVEGPYTIECTVGNTTSRCTVEVKKYVLPKFSISVQLDRPYYLPGQRARGEVTAKYFFGKPVAGGRVEVAVYSRDVRTNVIDRLQLVLDEEGAGSFEFPLPPSLVGRQPQPGRAELRFEVSVRDAAGQQQTRSAVTSVTERPILVAVIPESGRLVRGVANVVYLLTTYADGRSAKTRLSISGRAGEIESDEYGVAAVEIAPQSESVTWVIRATDDEGLIGRREVTLRCGDVPEDFLVRTDKAVYDGGQTMHLTALGGGIEPVFVDFVKDGQTLLTQTIDMADGRGELAFDLPPELCGTVRICTYRFGTSGLPHRKTRTIYVRQAGELSVRTRLDRSEYRPGDRARLELSLTDADGKPTPGAVSLAVVDEAVFSVLAQRPGLEQSFFTLEEEIVEPIYAIYDGTWAELFDTGQQKVPLQQALLAQTNARGVDRDAKLRELVKTYLEGDERILEVLQRPDWETLIDPAWFPAGAIELLRDEYTPHSLSATSYPEKLRSMKAIQRTGNRACTIAWAILGGVVAVGLFVALIRSDQLVGCLILLFTGGVLVSMMFPAVNSARQASRRMQAKNDLRQIGLALQMQQEEPGRRGEDPDSGTAAPRVRQWFPETLLWRPELITDDQGQVSLDVDLADSITTWRLTASAVSAAGSLGGAESSIRVFQPFFVDLDLPVSFTRGDEVEVPVVVYNYLDDPQTIEIALEDSPWFELLDDAKTSVQLDPQGVGSCHYRLRVTKVGDHQLQVTARAADVADAVKRSVEVVPDGRLVEQVTSGSLSAPVDVTLDVPADAIEGSVKAIVKIYPSSFSQVVEGLDAIFRKPYGCFEQTSSTTYPNVLALDYLRRTGNSAAEVEAKARQYIHLGYQRLLGFEVAGGGFDWFGNPPANRTLTAYGLMEFEDMARVHNVDPNVIQRTRAWLLERQNGDGCWSPESHRMHDDPVRGGDRWIERLSTTAYIGWAVFRGQPGGPQRRATLEFLRSHRPDEIASPYVLALVCNALVAIEPNSPAAGPYLDRLASLRQVSPDGKLVWWSQGPRVQTMFYGAGRSGDIETTASATLALLAANRDPELTRRALAWLIEQKDGWGTWHSTQATVLALKALLDGTGRPLGGERERVVRLALDDETIRTFTIAADQADVLQQAVLDDLPPGRHVLRLADRSDSASGFQVTFRHHVPQPEPPPAAEPLSIDVKYDRTQIAVNGTVTATATVVNHLSTVAPMVLLDLPIPPGFAVEPADFDSLVITGRIAKFQVTPRSTIVYLRQLAPKQPLTWQYRLHATVPVKVHVPAARVYLYYDPDTRGESQPAKLVVTRET